jgi:hypothetical protein
MKIIKNIIWALFGNDEDGYSGYNSGVAGYHGVVPTPLLAIKWWLRNPFHNLMFHVLRWPDGPFYMWNALGWYGYIGFRPNKPVKDVVYTKEELKWFADRDGIFGIAIRKGNKKYGES